MPQVLCYRRHGKRLSSTEGSQRRAIWPQNARQIRRLSVRRTETLSVRQCRGMTIVQRH